MRASRTAAWLLGTATAALISLGTPEAEARGSGGYSRPSFSRSTPSFGGSSRSYRTPSFSRGYSRPSRSYSAPSYRPAPSAGDRAFSQGRSGAALDAYRAQRQPRTPSFSAPAQRYSQPAQRAPQYSGGSGWLGQGYNPPAQGYFGSGRSFGGWNGFFLGALLGNLTRPGAASFFHNNQDTPGYREWRTEADRQAQTNADLRRQLAELDQKLAEQKGEPRTPGALPPDVPAEVAEAPASRTPTTGGGGGIGLVIVVVVLGGGVIAFLAWRRHTAQNGGSLVSSSTGGIGGIANMLQHKLSGEKYAPSKFRVGMTLQLDPTPFILAGSAIKLQPPEGSGSGQISVSAIGRVTSGGAALTRLYLPDDKHMVQLHVDDLGDPDECRLFGIIDEITPADPSEWAAWLDPQQGMIGYAQFQTKDGKVYDRVWAPGPEMVTPRVLNEEIEGLPGKRTVQSRAMLYAAATGAANPAPPTEYILVEARQDQGRAWVEVRAGIDISPVTLQLA